MTSLVGTTLAVYLSCGSASSLSAPVHSAPGSCASVASEPFDTPVSRPMHALYAEASQGKISPLRIEANHKNIKTADLKSTAASLDNLFNEVVNVTVRQQSENVIKDLIQQGVGVTQQEVFGAYAVPQVFGPQRPLPVMVPTETIFSKHSAGAPEENYINALVVDNVDVNLVASNYSPSSQEISMTGQGDDMSPPFIQPSPQIEKKAQFDAPLPVNVATFEFAMPLFLDERYLGDISVRIAGEAVSLPLERMIQLLEPDFTPEAINNLRASTPTGRFKISQSQLEGVEVNYNSSLQQIEVSSRNDALSVRKINLAYQHRDIDVKIEKPAKFSFFATPVVTSSYNWDDDGFRGKGFSNPRGTLDIGGRVGGEKGVAFLSRHSFDTGANGDFVRDETQLIYDDKKRIIRATAGDLRTRGASFQAIPALAGLSIERFFDLEPNRIFRPVGQSTFELERPSTVEIRINGVVQRELLLRPGRYDIADLPLVQGSNLVDLVIRDDTGRERVISSQDFFDFDLLQPGVLDFSIAGGVKTDFDSNGLDYTDKPIITGFIRRGMSSNVTLGADIQGSQDGANGGLSALWASPVGVLRFEAAGSSYEDIGSGVAADIGYKATGRSAERTGQWSLDLNARVFSEDFATVDSTVLGINTDLNSDLSLVPDDLRPRQQPFQALFNAGFQYSHQDWAFNAAGTYTKGRGSERDRANAIAGVNYSISSTLSAGVFGNYSDDGIEEDFGVNIQLLWRLGRNQLLRSQFESRQNQLELQYDKTSSQSVGGLAYGANVRHDFDTGGTSFDGDAFYTGNRFTSQLRHDVIDRSGFDGTSQTSRATVSSSLVFADGKVSIARPVREAFAIFEGHETLEGNKVFVNPTARGYSAKTDFLGAAVNTDISAFSQRSTYVDVENLPAGYDLGTGQFTLQPPLNAGYRLTVGSGASYTMIGYVKSRKTAEPVAYVGGRVTSVDNPDAEPIPAFTNRNGRLAASGLKPGRYKLRLFTNPEYTQEITVSEGETNLINLGEIAVDLLEDE